MRYLIGTKQTQTQLFDKDGRRRPVTVISTGPCRVVQIKNADTDGYWAVQLGLGTKKEHVINKPQQGHYKKAGLTTKQPRFLREIRIKEQEATDLKQGMELTAASVFRAGDEVMVTGTSKGKGFAGVIKRWGFHGGPKTHGQSDRHRAPGSVGAGSTPGRVLKGKKMAGRMGSDTVTIKGLTVMSVDTEQNTMTISGLVPGPKGGVLYITKTKDSPLPPEEEQNANEQESTQEQKQDTQENKDVKQEEKQANTSDNKESEEKTTDQKPEKSEKKADASDEKESEKETKKQDDNQEK